MGLVLQTAKESHIPMAIYIYSIFITCFIITMAIRRKHRLEDQQLSNQRSSSFQEGQQNIGSQDIEEQQSQEFFSDKEGGEDMSC